MAKLSTKARKALPNSAFAGPGRSFPEEDKAHARAALRLAPRALRAGTITEAEDRKIISRAHRVLGR